MRKKTGKGTEYIKCPFFRGHEPLVIGCEGITDDSAIRLIFQDKAGRDMQEDIFCKNRFCFCEIYQAIYKKYEEG